MELKPYLVFMTAFNYEAFTILSLQLRSASEGSRRSHLNSLSCDTSEITPLKKSNIPLKYLNLIFFPEINSLNFFRFIFTQKEY